MVCKYQISNVMIVCILSGFGANSRFTQSILSWNSAKWVSFAVVC